MCKHSNANSWYLVQEPSDCFLNSFPHLVSKTYTVIFKHPAMAYIQSKSVCSPTNWMRQVPHWCLCFCSMKWLDGMLVHHKVPSMNWLRAFLLPPPPPSWMGCLFITGCPVWITSPHGWDASLSQVTQHAVIRSITALPRWDVSASQSNLPQHFVSFTW